MGEISNMKILDKFTLAVIVIGILYFGIHFPIFVLRR
jgi:hypothetical protein